MHTIWFKGTKDKEERKKEVLGYRNAFDALAEVLEGKRKTAVRDYSPGWAEKQIAVNEYNAVIEEVLSIIKLDKET